jgi:hypothetical protein
MAVRTLAFSPEGAVLKWELGSGRRVAIVPRMGAELRFIAASSTDVVVSTDANAVKTFTANLDDVDMMTGLSDEVQDKGSIYLS